MSLLLDSKEEQKTIESSLAYNKWLELVTSITLDKTPLNLAITGSLSLALLKIRSLPSSLTITGDLDLRQCQRLSHVGDNLKVEGNLLIGGKLNSLPSYQKKLNKDSKVPKFLQQLSQKGVIPLGSLPENLQVKGNLIIRGAKFLHSLPKNLKLGGSLLLHGCKQLESLPESLELNGDLILISCPRLRKLPNILKANKLVLIGCGIEKLPPKMEIKELIHLESCSKITSLESITCLETGKLTSLIIDNCPIEELPYFVDVSYVIKLSKLPLKVLKEGFLTARSIVITNCKKLERVEALLSVRKTLSFRGCKKLEEFLAPPEEFYNLDLTDCETLKALPEKLYFSLNGQAKLVLTNCFAMKKLPASLEFNGRMEVSGCAVKRLPNLMSQCRVLWHRYRVPQEVVFAPEKLSWESILTEPNAEIRRLMLERVGIDKILSQAQAKVIDSDKDAGGVRSLLEITINNNIVGQIVHYLRCLCPSTKREYLLPVPPNIRKCHSAAAWLAGFDNPSEYKPILET